MQSTRPSEHPTDRQTDEPHENRVAVVTGAAAGVGRAVALRYSARGMRVIAIDQNDEGLTNLVRECSGPVMGVTADVRESHEVASAVSSGLERFGRVDVLAAVAGVLKVAPFVSMSQSDRDEVFGVNLFGVWNAIGAVLPPMLQSSGPRRILVCGSVASTVAGYGQAAYVASKHALVGLVKALALECAADGITVNLISPASVDTEMVRRHIRGPALERFLATTPVGRLSTAEEIASYFDFFASDTAGYATGSNILVDGGCSIVNSHNIDSLGKRLELG